MTASLVSSRAFHLSKHLKNVAKSRLPSIQSIFNEMMVELGIELSCTTLDSL